MKRETERTLRMIRRCGAHQQGEAAYPSGVAGNDNVQESERVTVPITEEPLFPAHPLPSYSDYGDAA